MWEFHASGDSIGRIQGSGSWAAGWYGGWWTDNNTAASPGVAWIRGRVGMG
jgi:hypothetical protein